ncbi:hypothetical protein JYU34_013541 [Plutella xylostella]|uniref:Uncharacterized protein n=1 Tax=Plutella xylostella TaxID=51655 RepID=A0ABQ7QA17_PLUXY|nr:hypothetical protein JYU34_013541 [Plutella xylostella]
MNALAGLLLISSTPSGSNKQYASIALLQAEVALYLQALAAMYQKYSLSVAMVNTLHFLLSHAVTGGPWNKYL